MRHPPPISSPLGPSASAAWPAAVFPTACPPARPVARSRRAFTLIELLIVIAIIGILSTLLFALSSRAIEQGRSAKCISTLKGLHRANFTHATENGYFVAAAADILSSSNRERWHGTRVAGRGRPGAFRGQHGPLAPYHPSDKGFRACPSFEPSPNAHNAFEKDAGGYGYNMEGVGSRVYAYGRRHEAFARGVRLTSIAKPAHTVMFTDAALGQPYGTPTYLIEYSFAEPYRHIRKPGVLGAVADPSIHFRHNDRANVVWCDGHVTSERMTVEATPAHTALKLGWFGERNNDLFDPK